MFFCNRSWKFDQISETINLILTLKKTLSIGCIPRGSTLLLKLNIPRGRQECDYIMSLPRESTQSALPHWAAMKGVQVSQPLVCHGNMKFYNVNPSIK